MGDTTGHVVAWAVAAGTVTQAIGPVIRWLSRHRLQQRRTTLEEVQQGQANLDASHLRLERENQRLTREINDVRTALLLEQGRSNDLEKELERIRERCDDCERFVRMMGRRSDLPEKPT